MRNIRWKEAAQFSGVGATTAVLDFILLNIFALWLGLPLVLANSISAPTASIVNYKLNKKYVFEDRMYGRVQSLLRYALIMAVGVVVIQNIVLFLVTSATDSDSVIVMNIAKLMAMLVSSIWNYLMLRKFVFVTENSKEKQPR